MPPFHEKQPFWTISLTETLKALNTSSNGLTSEEAEIAYKSHGPNTIITTQQQAIFSILFDRFKNPLVLLLLFSAILVTAVGETQGALIISIILLFSISLDTYQEYRASRIAYVLQQSVATRAQVWRDGKKIEILAADLVPGDVVEVESGDVIPGDGVVLAARNLLIDQAALTGESFPEEKRPLETLMPAEHNPAEVPYVVLKGSSVVSGGGRILLCHTGRETLWGEISTGSGQKKTLPSAFILDMQKFGMFLIYWTFILTILAAFGNLLFGRSLLETFLFSVALGVGMTPELLPMIVSLTFAKGAFILAQKKIVTKKLSSIYDLGSMNILCTDKTGTLTESDIQLKHYLNVKGETTLEVGHLAFLHGKFEEISKSPFSKAAENDENLRVPLEGWQSLDELPFDYVRRRVSVFLSHGPEKLLITKGPVESLLKVSTKVAPDGVGEVVDLTPELHQQIIAHNTELSSKGYKVLGLAWRYLPKGKTDVTPEDETNLVFAGLLSFSNPAKTSTASTLKALNQADIKVKVITGDNEYTTQTLCTELDFPIEGVLTGPEIAQMNDQQLRLAAEENTLFCRVTPDQKRRIVQVLRENGHVVGFMGDGINDVSALQAAQVSISVNNGASAAKEAAHFILLEKNLEVIYEGVREGRRIFANIVKYALMGTSSNFGNMISMVGAAFFLPFLPMKPVQILLNNLLYDLSEIGIPFDRVDEELLIQPTRWNIAFIKKFMLIFGPLSSLFDYGVFFALVYLFEAKEPLFQTTWFVESLVSQILVIFVIRTARNPFKSRPHGILLFSSLAAALTGIVLPFTSLGNYFGLIPLPTPLLMAIFGAITLYLTLAEISKRLFYRWVERQSIA